MKISIEGEQKLVERLESFGSSEDLWADVYSILVFVSRKVTAYFRPYQTETPKAGPIVGAAEVSRTWHNISASLFSLLEFSFSRYDFRML